jgi:hypothetical protein
MPEAALLIGKRRLHGGDPRTLPALKRFSSDDIRRLR